MSDRRGTHRGVDLLARAVAEDDLELAAIAVAADDHDVDIVSMRARLDSMAASIAAQLGTRHGLPRVRALVRAFTRDLGFHAPENYGDPSLHHLDRVLERRIGSPVALAVALVAIGRRAAVELETIAFPGSFLVRAGKTLIEPCTGAMPIPEQALCAMASEELGLDRAAIDALLVRAPARAVAVRMLENLEQAHRDRGDRARAFAVSERLLELGGPAARTQRVVLSLLRTLRVEAHVTTKRRLVVDRRGHSFRVDGEPAVDLRRRRALPLLVVRLAEHHRARPAHGLGWPALIEAGWPGEKIRADAAWARLRTAIRTLRQLGLSDVLITLGSGYALDPSWDVSFE